MSKLFYSTILLVFAVFGVECEESEDGVRHYNGYSVLRLVPRTEAQLKYLHDLEENVLELDFWKGPSYINRAVDVMVPPHLNHTFDQMFSQRNLEKKTLIDDLEKQLLEDRASVTILRPLRPVKLNGTKGQNDIVVNHFEDYQRLGNVYNFLDAIHTKYPDLTGVEKIGMSYTNREIRLIRIGEGQANKNKPIIFVEGGIHAREWISPATVQCFAQNLVQKYGTDPDITAILKKFDYYMVPVLNVDGYEHTHTSDRMWRKTRKPYGSCYGADPNRNFGYKWGGQGASANQCSETYRGSAPFSEPETKVISDYVMGIKSRTKAYFAIHSYGQYWLYPWGWTSAVTTDDKDLNRLGKVAINALSQQFGTRYTIGTSTNVLYAAAGGADDWAYGGAGIKYSYTVELRDTGNYGFTLPKTQIRDTCSETTAAFVAFAKELAKEV